MQRIVGMDIAGTLERLGGDKSLLYAIAEVFLEECPMHMAALRQAISEGDAGGIARSAHSLTGDLAYLGVPEASQKARDLEQMGRKRELEECARSFADLELQVLSVLEVLRNVKTFNFAVPAAVVGSEARDSSGGRGV